MLKTFFEKVPLKDGDVLINYTSAVKDATLERLFRYTISRFDSSKVIAEAEDFTCLIQARNAAWSNLGRMVKPLTPVACHETDDEATKETLDEDGPYWEGIHDKDTPYLPHDKRPFP